MGNTQDSKESKAAKEAEDASHAFLTKAEILALKQIYRELAANLSIEMVSMVFGSVEHELFSECVFYWMKKNVTDYAAFEKLIINCTRVESNKIINTLWKMLLNHPSINNGNKVEMFFTLVLMLSFPRGYDGDSKEFIVTTNRIVEFFNNSMLRANPNFKLTTDCDFNTLCGWINNYAPYTSKVLESYVSLKVFKNILSPSFRPFIHPTLEIGTTSIVTELDLMPLALFTKNMQDRWKRLYNSAMDGTSFNRIVHHILGYEGPTCFIIRCSDADKTILGFYSGDRWKENQKFYGSSSNLLFTLQPKVRVYRSKSPSNQNYQYLNMHSYANPHGLGLGGTVDGYRIFIPESLENCIAASTCPTYEPGRLVQGDKFEIDAIEIWGCGGEEQVQSALLAQVKERDITDEAIRKARKVDKAAFFNNAFDREFLLGGTFSHEKDMNKRS